VPNILSKVLNDPFLRETEGFMEAYQKRLGGIGLPKQYNLFNSNKWIFPVEKNQVILFPSNLVHGVDEDQREGVRLSLAFNVFLKGRLGNTRNLTELIL